MTKTQDLSISYNATKKKVQATIKKIKGIGFNVEEIEKQLAEIDNKLQNEVTNYSKTNTPTNNLLYEGSMEQYYLSGKSKLEELNTKLETYYGEYYEISENYKRLKAKKEDINEHNIEEYVSEIISLLNSMKSSSTIPYNMEEKLVNKIYKLVYETLKLENMHSPKEDLLTNVKSDDDTVNMIVEYLDKDIENMLENSKYKSIYDKKIKVGLDNQTKINEQVLTMVNAYENPEISMELERKFIASIEDIKNQLNIYKQKTSRVEDIVSKAIPNTQETLKRYKKKKGKKRIANFAVSLLLLAEIAAAGFAGFKLGNYNEYKTITTTYDSNTGDTTTTEDYEKGKDESLKMIEYGPWEEPSTYRDEDEYKRNIYKYTITDDDIDTIDELLNSEDSYQYSSDTETTKEKPSDYNYSGNKIVIEQVNKDLEDYQTKRGPIKTGLISGSIALILILITVVTKKLTEKEKMKEIKYYEKDAKTDIKLLKEEKDSLDLELLRLQEKLNKAKLDSLGDYYCLPETAQEDEMIKDGKEFLNQGLFETTDDGKVLVKKM